uniref:Uncharacterized protein n=1 Tax=Megaselia scalaris TaxID=36166 RepID=T1GQI8_MEGSC
MNPYATPVIESALRLLKVPSMSRKTANGYSFLLMPSGVHPPLKSITENSSSANYLQINTLIANKT